MTYEKSVPFSRQDLRKINSGRGFDSAATPAPPGAVEVPGRAMEAPAPKEQFNLNERKPLEIVEATLTHIEKLPIESRFAPVVTLMKTKQGYIAQLRDRLLERVEVLARDKRELYDIIHSDEDTEGSFPTSGPKLELSEVLTAALKVAHELIAQNGYLDLDGKNTAISPEPSFPAETSGVGAGEVVDLNIRPPVESPANVSFGPPLEKPTGGLEAELSLDQVQYLASVRAMIERLLQTPSHDTSDASPKNKREDTNITRLGIISRSRPDLREKMITDVCASLSGLLDKQPPEAVEKKKLEDEVKSSILLAVELAWSEHGHEFTE